MERSRKSVLPNWIGLFLPPLVFGGHIEKHPNSFKTVLEVKEQYFQMESWNK